VSKSGKGVSLALKAQRAARNERIFNAYFEGTPTHAIARWAGIGEPRVRYLITERWNKGKGDVRCRPHTEQQVDDYNARVHQEEIVKLYKRYSVEVVAQKLKISGGAVQIALLAATRGGADTGLKVGGDA